MLRTLTRTTLRCAQKASSEPTLPAGKVGLSFVCPHKTIMKSTAYSVQVREAAKKVLG